MMLWTSEWISDLLPMTSELHLVYRDMKRFLFSNGMVRAHARCTWWTVWYACHVCYGNDTMEKIRWRLPGVFEWHENHMLIVKFLKSKQDPSLHYLGIFGLHLTNGLLGGRGFYLAIRFNRFLGNPTSATFRNGMRFLYVDRYIDSNS